MAHRRKEEVCNDLDENVGTPAASFVSICLLRLAGWMDPVMLVTDLVCLGAAWMLWIGALFLLTPGSPNPQRAVG